MQGLFIFRTLAKYQPNPMKFKHFIKECHQKEVFKKLSLYVVTSWIIVQVYATIWEPLGLPKESVTILLIILLLGFPINVYLVWRFDLAKREESKVKTGKDGKEIPGKYQKSAFQKSYFYALTLISAVFIGIVVVVINNNFVESVSIDAYEASDKIAVETFGNNTGDPKNDIVGKMAADWIIHGISENQIGQVISQKTIDDYSNIVVSTVSPSQSRNLLKDYFKPGKIINGNFYEKGDKFLFQGSLIDVNKDDEQISFELVECNSDSPLECIEQLKQLILGYLILNENQSSTLESKPPKFDAYQHVITARANVKDNDIYIQEIEKALAADPEYFEPKLLEIVFYYNRENYKMSDSLLSQITPNSRTTPRQINILNMYKSLLEGNNRNAYEYEKIECGYNPFDIETNQSLMVLALQFINRPDLVDAIYEEIPSDDLIIENCLYCEYRIYVKSMSDIQLERYDSAIDLLKQTLKKVDAFYLNKPLSSAYIRSGRKAELDIMVSQLELIEDAEDLNELYLFIGSEFLLQKDRQGAEKYLSRIVGKKDHESRSSLAESYYLLEDFKNAELIFRELHESDPKDLKTMSRLASCLFKNQKRKEAELMIQQLESFREDFQYGRDDYLLAQYYSIALDEEKMFYYLLKSISQGNHYTISFFQNDPHFVNYLDNEQFKAILNYWH